MEYQGTVADGKLKSGEMSCPKLWDWQVTNKSPAESIDWFYLSFPSSVHHHDHHNHHNHHNHPFSDVADISDGGYFTRTFSFFFTLSRQYRVKYAGAFCPDAVRSVVSLLFTDCTSVAIPLYVSTSNTILCKTLVELHFAIIYDKS